MIPAGSLNHSGLPRAGGTGDTLPNEAVRPKEDDPQWARLLDEINRLTNQCGVAPGRVLVLMPYAQLMDAGRRAWATRHPGGFAPRFESSRNLAAALQPFVPGPTDLSMDIARDSLVAAAFVDRVAKGRAEPALRALMVSRLVEAATQLAPVAASVPPGQRLDWAARVRDALQLGPAALQWESLIASLALAWASTSAFATDAWWSPSAAPGVLADAMVVVPGFHDDPLVAALRERWAERATLMPLFVEGDGSPTGGHATLHRCADSEDEAQRAAACVVARINAGHSPVALVANDRMLVRRISALLGSAGIGVRDETGWKLSTTHAASQVMALLRAAAPRARMDDVLGWMKLAPAWSDAQVLAVERMARDAGVSHWHAALQRHELAAAVPADAPPLLAGLQAPRALVHWLTDTAQALGACGMWNALQADPAGQQVVRTLRLDPAAAQELAAVTQARMTLAVFADWARDALEGASFTPKTDSPPLVVVLPMAQLLGRGFAAAVMPGCDEVHLPVSPEPPGQWTVAQREALGLPGRAALAEAALRAWQAALASPRLDILWRTRERGESLLVSPWVEALQQGDALDPRTSRRLAVQEVRRPAPAAGDVLPDTLSASAYQDLRHCPYRFFALRQLRLTEAPELDEAPDQRDLGNWLHAVLRSFHERRGDSRPGMAADREALDLLAVETADAMGLNAGEGGAGFLPFEAVWPALRDGYLAWLAGYEARDGLAGPRFETAEAAFDTRLGAWKLYGKLDRVDVQPSPEGPIPMVIDYKTESRARTLERVREPLEDTQLAFYAALLPQDNLRAAYLSITDKRGDGPREAATLWVEQEDVLTAREQLRQGLVSDMSRVAGGQPMPALGEGQACDFCAARGLCRKDFWGGV